MSFSSSSSQPTASIKPLPLPNWGTHLGKTSSPQCTPEINTVQRFLTLVDRISDSLGLSVPPLVEMEYLRSLPPGTFGRAWADSLDQQQLPPLTTGPRRKQLHDGVHVLTGYGTDPIGEAEVQAFLLGAKFRLVHVGLTVGLLRPMSRHLAHHPEQSFAQVWTRLWHAYQRGVRSQFDVDTWQPEQQWNLPLSQVRSLAGVCR